MKVKGAHASNPDNGINPLYISKNIIDSVEKLSDKLNYKVAKKGSIARTNLYCNTPSNNLVPENVKLILDRRLSLGETEEKIKQKVDLLIKDTKRTSWMISDI